MYAIELLCRIFQKVRDTARASPWSSSRFPRVPTKPGIFLPLREERRSFARYKQPHTYLLGFSARPHRNQAWKFAGQSQELCMSFASEHTQRQGSARLAQQDVVTRYCAPEVGSTACAILIRLRAVCLDSFLWEL